MLLLEIGKYLNAHPATKETPFKLPTPGLPFTPAKPPPTPAVPRGWKINEILPLHSAAHGGGGVTDDMFKDMMAGMGMPAGALGDGAGGSGSGGMVNAAEKKEKKEKGKKKR